MSILNVPFFTPNSITGCRMWLDAQDNSVISLTSGRVSTVTDKALGTIFTSVGPTPANLTVASASINSFQSFYFNNSAGNYVGLRGNLAQLTTGTAIFVMKYISSQNGPWRPIFGWNDTTSVQSISFGTNLNGTGLSGPYVQNIGYNGSATATLTNNALYIVTFTFTGTTTGVGYNGQISLTAGTVSSYSGSSTSIGICQEVNASQMTTIYLGEIIIYNTVLGITDRQNVESYLAQKWGLTGSLPTGHPGIISTVYKSPIITPLVPIPYTAITYAFAPTQIAGCSLWLDGADPAGTGVAPALNASISTWADKSGLGNTATNQGGAGTVTYTTAGLVFNGSGYFYMPGLAGNIVNKPFVIFVVETLNTTNGSMLIGDDAQTNYGTDNVLHIMYRSSTNHTFAFFADDLEDYAVSGTGIRRLWTFYLPTAANRNTRRNGAVDVTHGNYNRLNYWSTPAIGRGVGGYNYVGTMSEVIIYPSDIGSTAINKVEAYLGQKWGLKSSLAAGHPGLTTDYYNSQSIVNRAALTAPTRLSLTTGSATGGTITTANGFRTHSFTTVGSTNFVVTGALKLQVLIVGGGGGGGFTNCAGGGGAGGAVATTLVISAGTYSVTVGGGGTGGNYTNSVTTQAANGTSSSFNGITGIGGGFGGWVGSPRSGAAGGCGGGGSYTGSIGSGGAGLQGGNGGRGSTNPGENNSGGGGGGMGGEGGLPNLVSGFSGGAGGLGATYVIGGTSYTVSGGGGGGTDANQGLGGSGIGGNGGTPGTPLGAAGNGAQNTGSGGGGGGGFADTTGGNGGSGIVIISYVFP
jgi:hypothetical protein